jgi:hypothetical protein
MNTTRKVAGAIVVAISFAACSDSPTGPEAAARAAALGGPQLAPKAPEGTGLVIDNATGVGLPLIGRVGTVNIDQAIITELVLVEDLAGNIIGVNAEGVLNLSGGVLGSDIVSQEFTTNALVFSSGKGGCDIVNVDLGPVTIDALGPTVAVDVPQGSVTPRASGALGPLLCNLGSLLNGPLGQVTSGVRGLVNAINQLIP